MSEVWLRPNRRVLCFGMILPAAAVAIGQSLAWTAGRGGGGSALLGWLITAAGAVPMLLLALHLRLPRLAYADGQLLAYVSSGGPIRVPIEVIECCFLSAGPGQVLGRRSMGQPVRNLVLRVAQRASDFQSREVKPALGRWQDGYLTIHGAWCEPLTLDLVQRLNARLAELHQAPQQGITKVPRHADA